VAPLKEPSEQPLLADPLQQRLIHDPLVATCKRVLICSAMIFSGIGRTRKVRRVTS
jgi:hypothetical protein